MPNLANYRAFLFDIDQTLTNSQRQITPETHQALERCAQAGLTLGFCTGKHWAKITMEHLEHTLPDSSTHVLTGGAQVCDNHGQVLWEKTIPAAALEQIHQAAERYQAIVLTKTATGFWGSSAGLAYAQGKDLEEHVTPFPENELNTAPAIAVITPSPEFEAFLDTLPDLTITKMHHYNHTIIDVTAAGITKAAGLAAWSNINGIPIDQVVGFGDSANDLQFLDTVGYAVAMGNATDEIKAVADKVIGHTDDNGLATYLNHVLDTGEV